MDGLIIIGIGLSLLILILYIYYSLAAKRKAHREKLEKQRRDLNSEYNQKFRQLEKEKIQLHDQYREKLWQFEKEKKNLNNRVLELEEGIRHKDEFYNLLKMKSDETISKISSLYSDFLLIQYDISETYLKTKPHPAYKKAESINELKIKSKAYLEQYRQMMYKYEALLQLFPELSNYVDDFESIKQLEDFNSIKELQSDFDRVQFFISKEEYHKLSIDERNQLALDRYINGPKSKWQIGRDYELFCGMEYEKNGWNVTYIGIEKKLNDMGRDLIAVKGREHHVIQCKYWAKEKLIHEKHITQIYGTCMEYEMNFERKINVTPIFITNITLSVTAKKFANKLGVVVKDNIPLEEFPRIKCNINRDEYGDETRIYHLPFDQQYDRTKIYKDGEFYAYNVKEAVERGFRRAYRYYGE